MKMNRIIVLLVFVLLIPSIGLAQVKKNTKRTSKKVQKDTIVADTVMATDTVALFQHKEEPPHKSLSDPLVVRYILGGYSKDRKLHLYASVDYPRLSFEQKTDLLLKVKADFPDHDMLVYTGEQSRELWISYNGELRLVEQWNNDTLAIEDYSPLELKRGGQRSLFYSVGGAYGGGKGYSNGNLSLRTGTYLFENILDASVLLDLGYNKDSTQTQFAGDVSIAARAYLPLKIEGINLAPYVGSGISWAFAPTSFFELQLLAGGCWFVKIGSVDFGVQYGTQSGFSVTAGFTFRPSAR